MAANVSESQIIQASYFADRLRSAGSCLTKAVKSGVEAYICGSSSPLVATVTRVGVSAFQWLKSKFGTSYGKYGKQVESLEGATLVIGAGAPYNEMLVNMLNKHAKKLGLQSDINIKIEDSDMVVSSLDSAVLPFSFRVNCNVILGCSREAAGGILEMVTDPVLKRSMQTFLRSPQYLQIVDFVAAQMASHIKMNTNAFLFAVDVICFYLSKVLIERLAETNKINTDSFSFIMTAGYLSQFLPFMLKAYIHRRSTYQADRKAVELTENPRSAMEFFQIFGKHVSSIAGVERLLNNVQSLFIPSYNDRIEALRLTHPDAFHEIEQASQEGLVITPRMRIQFLNDPVVQFILQVLDPRNKEVAKQYAIQTLPSIAYFIYSAYSIGDMDIDSLIFWYGFFSIIFQLNPKVLDESFNALFIKANAMRSFFSSSSKASLDDSTSLLINQMAEEMGISKAVELRYFSDSSKSANSSGCDWGPGQAVIRLPKMINQIDPEELRFILAHELAHIKKNHLNQRTISSLALMVLAKVLLSRFGFNGEAFSQLLMKGLAIKLMSFTGSYFLDTAQERQADRMAGVKHAEGGIQFFTRAMGVNRDLRNHPTLAPLSRFFIGVQFSALGDNRFDFEHPPLSERIRVLEENKEKQE